MLYKFNRAAADPSCWSRKRVQIPWKSPANAGPTGIATAAQILAALAALEGRRGPGDFSLSACAPPRWLPRKSRADANPAEDEPNDTIHCASAPRLSSTCCAAANKRAATVWVVDARRALTQRAASAPNINRPFALRRLSPPWPISGVRCRWRANSAGVLLPGMAPWPPAVFHRQGLPVLAVSLLECG